MVQLQVFRHRGTARFLKRGDKSVDLMEMVKIIKEFLSGKGGRTIRNFGIIKRYHGRYPAGYQQTPGKFL